MQRYCWTGIDLKGQVKNGKKWARSQDHLINLLILDDIGLVKSRESYFSSKQVKHKQKIVIISRLVALLKNGFNISHALGVVKDSFSNNKYVKIVLSDIKDLIESGQSITNSFKSHPNIFDYFVCSLISAGEHTGNLVNSLDYFVKYSDNLLKFRKKVMSLLLTPFITFVVFFLIVIALLMFIVPRFESIFSSFDKPLPASTYYILLISKFLGTNCFLFFIVFVLCLLLLLSYFLRNSKFNWIKQVLILNTPILNKLYKLFYKVIFFQMLNVLLVGGVSLVDSLEAIAFSIKNSFVYKDIVNISNHIKSGQTFSGALSESKLFSGIELLEIINIGESTGDLTGVVSYLSDFYTQTIYGILKYFANIIQPLILIILGLLIAGIILALYVPIFTLSSIIE